jgi:hypothetical protein
MQQKVEQTKKKKNYVLQRERKKCDSVMKKRENMSM